MTDVRTEIIERLKTAKDHSKNWHGNIVRWRKLYEFKQYKSKKAGEYQFEDPTYTNLVDLAVGIMMSNRLNFHVRGWEPSIENQKNSSDIEKYLAGLIDINSDREEYDILYESLLNFVRDGTAVLYSVWDHMWHKEFSTTIPMEDKAGNPIQQTAFSEPPLRMWVVDPLKMYLLPGGPKRWLCQMREEEMSIYDVETIYGVTLTQFKDWSLQDKINHKSNLIDYWCYIDINDYEMGEDETGAYAVKKLSDQQKLARSISPGRDDGAEPNPGRKLVVANAMIFDQEVLKPLRVMEGYNYLPYTIGFYKPIDRDKSEGWGHGIIRPVETSVDALGRAINRRDRQITMYSSLPLTHTGPEGRHIDVEPGMGTVMELGPNEALAFPIWPGNAPDIEEHITHLRGKVQQSGFSETAFGMGSDVSGFALSQLNDQNRIRLTQPTIHFQRFISYWARKVLDLTASFADGSYVRVYGNLRGQNFSNTVLGTDINQYLVEVKLKPEFPNEKVRNHAMANQVRDIVSESYLMEHYLDIEQPDDMRKERMQEMLLKSPVLQQFAAVREIMRQAKSGDEEAAIYLQILQNGGMPGQGGRPKDPAGKEQPLGMPSSTGQPTDQEQGGPPDGQGFGDQLDKQANAAPKLNG